MQRDGFRCIECDSEDKTLNVHHDYYVSGRMPWEYPDFSLKTLCYDCHSSLHERVDDEPFLELWWESFSDWLDTNCPTGYGGDLWYIMAELSMTLEKIKPEQMIDLQRAFSKIRNELTSQ